MPIPYVYPTSFPYGSRVVTFNFAGGGTGSAILESIEITERKVDDLGDNLEEVTYLKVPQEGAQNQQGQELIERVVRETGQQGQPSQEQR